HTLPKCTPFPYTTLFRSIELANREEGNLTQIQEPEEELEVYVPEESDIIYKSGTITNRDALETFIETAGENGDDNESNIRVVKEDRKSTRLNSSHVSISY